MTTAFTPYDLGEGITLFRGELLKNRLTFNSYLIDGDHPALIHAGNRDIWPLLKKAIREVLPLERLSYLLVPHFEADGCGSIQQVIEETGAKVIASATGAMQIKGFGLADRVKQMKDGDKLRLEKDRWLEMISVPSEMHLWDGLMFYDKKTVTLFSNDFLSQFGGNIDVHEKEVPVKAMAQMNQNNLPHPEPFLPTLKRLETLPIQRVAPGHGSLVTKEVDEWIRRYFVADF